MGYRYSCVIDSTGTYKTFVLVTQELGENGQIVEHIQYYTLGDGERMINASPPPTRPHAGAEGLVKPRWGGSAWVEGATPQEIEQWELEHPAPEPVAPEPTPEQQQLAALTLNQAQQDRTIAQLQQANAALMLQLAQAQTGGGDANV